jgi:adenosine deaminase
MSRQQGLRWDEERVLSLYRHESIGQFLVHFGALLDLFKSPEDLCWLLDRTLARLRRQGVIYAEIRLSPSVWERHGLQAERSLLTLLNYAARRSAPVGFIVDAVRQWDQALQLRDLDLACSFRKQGVVALGIGGDEAAAPASGLKALADECKARGIPVIPHAGEVLGPDEVASAVKVFHAARIGHGIGAAESPGLLDDLARRGTHLEVCPTSNRRTGVVTRGRRHPLRQLWKAGVSLSLGTDDPAMFGATLCGELRWAKRSAGWTHEDMMRSQVLAARASLLTGSARDDLARRIRAGWEF